MAIVCAQCGHRNPDGATFCGNADCRAFLAWSGPGGGNDPHPAPPGSGDTGIWRDAAASISLTDSTLAATPGETVSTTVSVHNGGPQVEQFAITVIGPTADWVEIDEPVLRVYPDARGETVIRWSPPRSSTTYAGQAWFTVRATSVLHQHLQKQASGTLTIAEFRELAATLTPQTTAGRWQTTHRIELANGGNTIEPVQLKAVDPAGRIRFSIAEPELTLPPGTGSVDVGVRPPVRWFGKPVSQPFQVFATPRPPTGPVRLDGTREVVPIISPWVLRIATALLALTVVGVGAVALANRDDGGDGQNGGSATAPPSSSVQPTIEPTGPPSPSDPTKTDQPSTSTPSPSSTGLGNADTTPWIVVSDQGETVFADGAESANLGPGLSEVRFGRNVRNCVYVASIAASDGERVPEGGLVVVARGEEPDTVKVVTRDPDGTARDYPFHLQVRCGVGDTAVVSPSDGRAVRGNNQPQAARADVGLWDVVFNRNVRECAVVATIGDPDEGDPPPGFIAVGRGRVDDGAVLVETRGSGGTANDVPFHVQTLCDGRWAIAGPGLDARTEQGEEPERQGEGQWRVDFDDDVSGCSYVATIADAGAATVGTEQVFAASGPDPTSVLVETRFYDRTTNTGTLADLPFHLQVQC